MRCCRTSLYNLHMLQKTITYKIIWTVLAMFMLMACSQEAPGIAPEQLASRFYDAIINKDFNTAVSFYGPEMPAETHLKELQQLQMTLGDLQSYKLQDTIVNTVFSGTRYIYTYRLQYTTATAKEMLVMFNSVRGEPLHIEVRNYKIKSHATHDDENPT